MKRNLLVLLIVGVALSLAAPAMAQYPPERCRAGYLKASATTPDGELGVTFCALAYNSGLTVGIVGTGVQQTVPVTGPTLSVTVPVPAGIVPGSYTLFARGIDEAGKPIEFEIPFTVLDPASPEAAALTSVGGATVGSPARGIVGSKARTQVKGTQLSANASEPLGSSTPVSAGMKFAGFGMLGLLALSGLGALGYTAAARIRR